MPEGFEGLDAARRAGEMLFETSRSIAGQRELMTGAMERVRVHMITQDETIESLRGRTSELHGLVQEASVEIEDMKLRHAEEIDSINERHERDREVARQFSLRELRTVQQTAAEEVAKVQDEAAELVRMADDRYEAAEADRQRLLAENENLMAALATLVRAAEAQVRAAEAGNDMVSSWVAVLPQPSDRSSNVVPLHMDRAA